MGLLLRLLGLGAMNSPRFPPAGLLVGAGRTRVMLDGGPEAVPEAAVAAWLVTDERGELVPAIRRIGRAWSVAPAVAEFSSAGMTLTPLAAEHTSHPACGYLIEAGEGRAVWAPEFWTWPSWAAGADIMFAEAAGWDRPIRFRGGVGGHAAAVDVCRWASESGVKRLVLAHIGRPSLRAMDAGARLPFGEWGRPGHRYRLSCRAGPGQQEP